MKTYTKLGVIAGLLATTAPPHTVLAQETALAQEEDGTEDVITVIGTNIRGLDLEGATPAVQVDRQDILESGQTNIIDVLRDLTITGGGAGTFSTSSAGALSSDTPVGAAGVSLRGLGTSSTLTLINGKRASVSAFANGQESFIDVNAIPLSAIERVEVLPSGASALYGADAVAGVVNFVLRKDFVGQEISLSYGDSTAGTDEGRINVNGVFGREIGGHNVMVVVDYFKRNALFDRDRDFSRDSVRPSQQGFFPSFNDLFLQVNDQTEEPQDGGCPQGAFDTGNFGEFCEVDVNDFTSTLDELETIGGLFTHQYEINNRIKWYNEFLYQRSESNGTSSPANFSRTPVDPENPFWPEALQEDIIAEGGAGDFSDFFGFPIFAWGKIPEPRAVEVVSKSFRGTTGMEVDLTDSWSGEVSFLYGGNDRTQRGLSGLVRSEAFYNANLGNLCTDGTTVERWDIDFERPTADFVGDTCEAIGKETLWYNPFGGQLEQSPSIDEALRTTAERTGKSRMYAVNATASGDVIEFADRTVKGAFGAEFLRETLEDTPSGEAVATLGNPEPILGFSSTSADIERNQWAIFGELYVPVFEGFDLQVAGRYDDYEGFGGDFNPKVAFRYQPVEQVIFRGNWSTSFRAPSLAQSGAGVLLSSFTVDCEDTPGACGGNDAADGEALLSEDVGNLNLGAENARTWGLGVLLRPTESIELNFDYWNIRHEDLVGIDEDDFIRRALAGEFAVVGQGELPTGTPGLEVADNGFVTDAHFQIDNLGFQETDGFDLAYTQYFDFGEIGELTFLFDATYLLNFDRLASTNSPLEELAGDFRFPRLLANSRLRWRTDNWRASIAAFYTGSYEDDPSSRTLETLDLPADADVEVDNWITVDLNLSYDYHENGFIQLNVRNVFNEDPPRVLGLGSNVDQINHNSLGRFITLRVTQAF